MTTYTDQINGVGGDPSASDAITGGGQGLAFKAPVRVATTANITLSGTQTIDGVAVVAQDRVLVKNQTNAVDNGIWIVSSGSWSRATDMDSNRDLTKGTRVAVTDGTTNARSVWAVTSTNPIAVGSDSIAFEAVTFGQYGVLDEDDMASNSDDHVPTQQSVKAFVEEHAEIIATGSTTPRSLADRFADIVNVLDFASVSLAADYAMANDSTLFFPPGLYTLTEKLAKTLASNRTLRMQGSGEEQTILLWSCDDGGIEITFSTTWWLRVEASLPGNAFTIEGMTLATDRAPALAGTAIKVDGLSAASHPINTLQFARLTFRGTGPTETQWAEGISIDGLGGSQSHDLTWFGYNDSRTGSVIKIRGDLTHQPVNHKFTNLKANFFDIGFDLGQYVEGVHIENTTLVSGNHGIYWDAVSAESQLALHNSHINSDLEPIWLNRVFDSQIVGNLLFTNDPGITAILVREGGYNTIVGNTIRSGDGTGDNGIHIDYVSTWNAAHRNVIVGNFIMGYATGVRLDASSLGTVMNGNAFASCTVNLVGAAAAGDNGATAPIHNFFTEDGQAGRIRHAAPGVAAANYLGFGSHSTGNSPVIEAVGSDTNIDIRLLPKGTGVARVVGGMVPHTDDGAALGSTTFRWADFFLAVGGVINWGNGDVLLTHSANALAFSGASSGYTFDADIFRGADRLLSTRKTGWAVDTGTAKRTANATYSGTAEVGYTQATIQTLMNAVRDLSQTVKALKDDLHGTAGHGLIGT